MSIKTVYAAGGRVSGAGWKVGSMSTSIGGMTSVIRADILLAPQVVVRRKGGRRETFPGGHLPTVFRLTSRAENWRLDALQRSQ
jgi:hypothetical protein